MMHGTFLPGVGINVFFVFFMEGNLVVPVRMAGRINNSGVMAAVGQYKSYIRIGQQLNFVNRPPRRHMIGDCADRENRDMNVPQGDRPAIYLVATASKIIIQKEATEVFGVHAVGPACRVRIPCHEVDHWLSFAHEIGTNHHRPNQIVRGQQLKRS